MLEIVAAGLGLLSVWLTIRQNVWCWPIGAAMVAMYAYIFARERLYADAGLQVVYFLLQFYGWYQWLWGGTGRAELPVTRTPRHWLPLLLGLGALASLALGYGLARFTDQHLAYLDSAISVFSLLAQWMLARKYLENWLLWIGIDLVAVGVFLAKELYPTAVLYAIFLLLALQGYRTWRKSMKPSAAREPQPSSHPAPTP